MTPQRTTADDDCRAGDDAACGPLHPARGPGDLRPWPGAERPPRREEGTVSDPDQYAEQPTAAGPAKAPYPRVGTVSDLDF
jgi:hypothetical protein